MLKLHLHEVGRNGGELGQHGWWIHVLLPSLRTLPAKHLHRGKRVWTSIIVENHCWLVTVFSQMKFQGMAIFRSVPKQQVILVIHKFYMMKIKMFCYIMGTSRLYQKKDLLTCNQRIYTGRRWCETSCDYSA